MTIPWMNLSRRPSEIHLKGLFILIVPKNGQQKSSLSLSLSSIEVGSLQRWNETNEKNERTK